MRRIALLAVFAACGNNSHGTGDGNGDDGPPVHMDASMPCINTAGPPLPTPTVVTGTNVSLHKVGQVDGGAILVTSPPNDARMFVLQQTGEIRIIDETGALRPDNFLDFSNTIIADAPPGERGLLGLAFHPNYACNGVFFIDYTTSNADIIEAFHVGADINHADSSSGQVVLSIPDFASNHNGGMIDFGDDGFLYVSAGDGGGADDPHVNGQAVLRTDPQCVSDHCEPWLGKLLRLDVDHPAGGKMYGIPANNPYSGGGGEPEILLRGLRNPWRWSFDRGTGDLYIGDVGQNMVEEVDVIAKAQIDGAPGAPLNLGWSICEGNIPHGNGGTCAYTNPTAPVATWTHSGDGWDAVIGGQVYRGQNYPGIVGNYYFSDNGHGGLYEGTWNPLQPTTLSYAQRAGVTLSSPSSIHAGPGGELYVTTTGIGVAGGHGEIFHVEAGP